MRQCSDLVSVSRHPAATPYDDAVGRLPAPRPAPAPARLGRGRRARWCGTAGRAASTAPEAARRSAETHRAISRRVQGGSSFCHPAAPLGSRWGTSHASVTGDTGIRPRWVSTSPLRVAASRAATGPCDRPGEFGRSTADLGHQPVRPGRARRHRAQHGVAQPDVRRSSPGASG